MFRQPDIDRSIDPSIADIVGNEHGSAFLFEHPLMRKRSGEEEYRGAVDYWVMYRDFAFLIELKHSYFAYNRKKPRQSISKKFKRALDQLEIVRKSERVELATGCKDMVAIALETVVFFKRSERKLTRAAFREDDFGKHFVRLDENLHCGSKTNVHCLWVLDEKLVNDFEYSDCHEIYPAIAFIGHISHKSVRSV